MRKEAYTRLRRIVRKPYGWILALFYPELAHLTDADERWYALSIVTMNLPRNQQLLWNIAFFVVMIIGAATPFLINILFGGGVPQINTRLMLIFWLVVLPGTSVVIFLLGLFWFQSLFIRQRCRDFLHNIGTAICPACGYSTLGHAGESSMRCPECGHDIDLRSPD